MIVTTTTSGIGQMLNKVPAVTAIFWIVKIMSTTVGETGADYLAVHVGLGTALTTGIMVAQGGAPHPAIATYSTGYRALPGLPAQRAVA